MEWVGPIQSPVVGGSPPEGDPVLSIPHTFSHLNLTKMCGQYDYLQANNKNLGLCWPVTKHPLCLLGPGPQPIPLHRVWSEGWAPAPGDGVNL